MDCEDPGNADGVWAGDIHGGVVGEHARGDGWAVYKNIPDMAGYKAQYKALV